MTAMTSNPNQYPDAEEICDELDNNCDGFVDEGVLLEQFLDNDGDGFGDATNRIEQCTQLPSYVLNDSDCNDDNANQYPNAPEICNLEDDDCDNQSDEGTDANAPIGSPTWYLDFDGDGIGTDSLSTISCFAPPDFVATVGDCLDDDPTIYPGANEVCDNIDQDCDGVVDNNPVAGVTFMLTSMETVMETFTRPISFKPAMHMTQQHSNIYRRVATLTFKEIVTTPTIAYLL